MKFVRAALKAVGEVRPRADAGSEHEEGCTEPRDRALLTERGEDVSEEEGPSQRREDGQGEVGDFMSVEFVVG